MSHVQCLRFSASLCLPTSLLDKLVLPYWGEGIRVSLFMAFLPFLFVLSYFLPEGRNQLLLLAPGAI